MTNEKKDTEFVTHNYDAVNNGVNEVARRASIFSSWLHVRVLAERLKIVSLFLLAIGVFLILLAIAVYIGRGYLSIKHESGGTRIEYIKVPDPDTSRVIEKTIVIEKPVYIPTEIPEQEGVKNSFTIFRSVKQEWSKSGSVTTGIIYENSKEKYPESQYCYVVNDVEEDGVEEKIDIAGKKGRLGVQNYILNGDQAKKIGISLQKLSSLNSDCRFLDVGMGIPNSERENPPKLDPIDPSGVKLSSGSGFFVNSEGKILTNEHVITSCDVIAVRYSDGFSRLSLISKNESLDLAILELNEERSTDFLSFADSIETGQDVYAFGYPLGDQLSEEIKVTNGIISSLAGIKNDQTRMQITNALQPGNSGGPLTDAFGLVVGVNASVLRGEQYQNINFSIKREKVLQFLANNKIEFSVESSSTEKKGADIVRDMKKSVFPIYCASKS